MVTTTGEPRITSALVTGGGSGIGAAACRLLARAGARIAVVDVDEGAARVIADEVGGLAVCGDVSSPGVLQGALEQAEQAFGVLDVVLLNAGTASQQSGFDQLDVADYRRVLGVNVDHVVLGLTAAVPVLTRAGGGRIVVTASLAGLVPMPGDPIYTLTKHAVVGYVRAVAPVLADQGIRVNAVCPGFADTPLLDPAREQLGDFPLLRAEDVAQAIGEVLEQGRPGECWFVQPGRPAERYAFRGVPGPKSGAAAPAVGPGAAGHSGVQNENHG
jgi:NAD(P)-dependent dehydrogenase (short-subunit alcohol dehydrogenase family)